MGKIGIFQETPTVEEALKQFSYFDTWNKKTISDCCRLSKIKVVAPDNVILGCEGKEINGVHFIVEGTCKLIEHLYLKPNEKVERRASYRSFRDKRIDAHTNVVDEPKYSSLLFNMDRNMYLENLEHKSEKSESNAHKLEKDHTRIKPEEKEVVDSVTDDPESDGENDGEENVEMDKHGLGISQVKIELPGNQNQGGGKFSKFYRRLLPYISSKNKYSFQNSENAESHFLQIAMVYKGCCLGLGERLHNRFLVSVTNVICMVIPLQFLLQHNPNNIWNRIKQFLDNYLPTHEKVLSEYFLNRKWNEDKHKLILSKNVKSTTKLSDVPRSIRLSDSNKRLH